MAEPFFNLVDEPWVPVLDADGHDLELSLREVFHQAPDLISLTGELPTQSFAILRVLLAILHRAVAGPFDVDQWCDIRDDWCNTLSQIDTYLDDFHDRFWIQHPTQPFMQVADLVSTNGEVSGLSRIICDGSGSSTFLSTRLGEDLQSARWAEAARWLVHAMAFDISGIHSGAVGDPRVTNGKGYGIGTGWAGQIGGVFLVGGTLFDTLMLNLLVPEKVQIAHGDYDSPVWERDPLTAVPEGWLVNGTIRPYRQPHGLVDVYTWPSRRIRLFGTAEIAEGVINAQGDKLTGQNRFTVEPMTSWRYSAPQTKASGKDTYMPLKHETGKALWRGLASILPHVEVSLRTGGPASRMPPATVKWAEELRFRSVIDDRLLKLQSVGMNYGTNEAVYDEMVSDTLTIPTSLLLPEARDLAQEAVSAVRRADEAVFALGSLAQNIALASGGSSDSSGPRERASESAYAALDGEFRTWIITLDQNASTVERGTAWQQIVCRVVQKIADQVVDQAGPAAIIGRSHGGTFRDAGLSMVWFRKQLRTILPDAFAITKAPSNEERK